MTDTRLLEQEVELRRIRRQIQCTPADVMRIARDNAIVATVIRGWQEGDFRTWEEAMTAAVCYLAQQNDQLLKTATMKMERSIPSIVIELPDSKKATP
jgi:hypothetical protein